jgi:hypothetical protein
MSRARIIYLLGWATAIVAFVYKALTLTSVGLRVAEATRLVPHHFLQTSLLLFVISIAEAAYSWAGKDPSATRSAAT